MRVWPGRPYPLGATFDGFGVNFSLFSEVAERVELCLFAADGRETRVDLPETTALCWHGYLPDVKPGQSYGYRVHGPWDPGNGLWCNPSKLLLDPYAKAVEGSWNWHEAVFPYHFGQPESSRNDLDSAPYMPKMRRHQSVLRLGAEQPAQHPMAPHGGVRDAREGIHDQKPRDPGRCAWHLRRHGASCRREVSPTTRRDGR